MLHEILLALAGHPGDIVVCCDEKSSKDTLPSSISTTPTFSGNVLKIQSFHINTSLDFFNSTERDILNRIVAIGYDYALVKNFINQVKEQNSHNVIKARKEAVGASEGSQNALSTQNTHKNISKSNMGKPTLKSQSDIEMTFPSADPPLSGYYISAICTSMQSILDKYLEKICNLEKEIMADPLLPISFFVVSLQHEKIELQLLRHFVEKINSTLGLIVSVKKLLHVFDFDNLSRCVTLRMHWYYSMELAASPSKPSENSQISCGPSISCGQMLDHLWQGTKSGNPITQTLYKQLFEACSRVFIYQLTAWILHGQLLDPYSEFFIQRKLFARSALETKDLFLSARHSAAEDLSEFIFPDVLMFEWSHLFQLCVKNIPSCCVSISTARKIFFIGKVVRLLTRAKNWSDLNVEEANRIAVKLYSLTPHNFSVQNVDIIIEDIRIQIAGLLWKLVVEDGNLLMHLKSLKDYYLLGNGLFFHHFIEASWHMMNTPPGKRSENDLQFQAWSGATAILEESLTHYSRDAVANLPVTNTAAKLNSKIHFDPRVHERAEDAYRALHKSLVPPRKPTEEWTLAREFYPKLRSEKFLLDAFPPPEASHSVLSLGGLALLENSKLLLSTSKSHTAENTDAELLLDTFSCCWYNQKQRLSYGFTHGFDFLLDTLDGPVKANSNNGRRGGRFAVVFQNILSPSLYRKEGHMYHKTFWPMLGDCLAIEFTANYMKPQAVVQTALKRMDPQTIKASVEVSVFIGGYGMSKVLNCPPTGESVDFLFRRMHISKEKGMKSNEWKEANVNRSSGIGSNAFRNDACGASPVLLLKSGVKSWLGNPSYFHSGFRVRIQYLSHHFEVYVDPLASEFTQGDDDTPILKIAFRDVIRMFKLDMGTAFIGFATLPLKYKHVLLSQETPLDQWIQNKEIPQQKRIEANSSFTTEDCCIQIVRWFHSALPLPLSLPALENRAADFPMDWQNLSLSYSPKWPLILVLDLTSIDTYNSLFQLLFLLKRSHYNLLRVWIDGAHWRKVSRSYYKWSVQEYNYVWLVRSRMEFVLTQIILYVQETVIEKDFKGLCDEIMQSRDFEKVNILHDAYLSQLATQCFLRIKSLPQLIVELVNSVLKFCSLFHKELEKSMKNSQSQEESRDIKQTEAVLISDKENYDSQLFKSELISASSEFLKISSALYEEMLSLSSSLSHVGLGQLTLKLNYNDFFDAHYEQ